MEVGETEVGLERKMRGTRDLENFETSSLFFSFFYLRDGRRLHHEREKTNGRGTGEGGNENANAKKKGGGARREACRNKEGKRLR